MGKSGRSGQLVVLVLVAVLGLTVGAAGGTVLAGGRSGSGATQWDPRIASEAQFVAQMWQAPFKRTVAVAFVPDAEFEAHLATAPARGDLDPLALRAVGLLGAKADPQAAVVARAKASRVAYYDEAGKVLYVRGAGLTPYREGAVVSELTRALVTQRLDPSAIDREGVGARTAFDAVVGAAGERAAKAWADQFDASKRAAYASEQTQLTTKPPTLDQSLPPLVDTLASFPGLFGPSFLDMQFAAQQGASTSEANAQLYRVLDNPPSSVRMLLDPAAYAAASAALSVAAPALPAGAKLTGDHDLGEFALAVVLSSRLSGDESVKAAEGWGGDHLITYESDGKVCMALAVQADTPDDLNTIETAFAAWAAKTPDTAAASHQEDTAILTSCEPASAAAPSGDAHAVVETLLAHQRQGAPAPVATTTVPTTAASINPDAPPTYNDPRFPKQWDPRLLKDVAFVEKHWGRQFVHPVKALFLSDAEFRSLTSVDGASMTEIDQRLLKLVVARLRALGMASGNVDLVKAIVADSGDSILGFYSPESTTLVVRGETMTPYAEAVVVHELTHALQDQYVALGFPASDGARAAFSAVVEGDARRIERMWFQQMTPDQLAQYRAAEQKLMSGAKSRYVPVPAVLNAVSYFPYAYGPAFLAAELPKQPDGTSLGILQHPPATEEQVLDPASYDQASGAPHVDAPSVPQDAIPIGNDDAFGAFQLLVLLAPRVGLDVATKAVEGAAGNHEVTYLRNDRVCVAVALQAHTPADLDEMRAALQTWVGSMPTAQLAVEGETLTLRSCDPGVVVPGGDGRDLVFTMMFRQDVIAFLVQTGYSPAAASCTADAVVKQFDATQMEWMTPEDAALDPIYAYAGAACKAASG